MVTRAIIYKRNVNPDDYDIPRNQPNEVHPLLVDNYPSGYVKVEARFWLEFVGKKGVRGCFQSKNKSGVWCKPKKGTYSMFLAVGWHRETGQTHFILDVHNYNFKESRKKLEVLRTLNFTEIVNLNVLNAIRYMDSKGL